MADISGAIVYAAFMATLETIKDECKKHDECTDKCPFRHDDECLLHAWPDRYDLDKIGEALKKDGDQ